MLETKRGFVFHEPTRRKYRVMVRNRRNEVNKSDQINSS
jgi:hypothetical protein